MHNLNLDETSLKPEELSMPALMQELNRQKRPNWLLRKLMNSLESKRMLKKLGWSRPWNKYGLTIFRSHILDLKGDGDFLKQVFDFLDTNLPELEEPYRDFYEELKREERLMGFTFYHNNSEVGAEYEGLTLSLGRIASEERTRRDRLDLILEDKRDGGGVDGKVDRMRVIINPLRQFMDDKYYLLEREASPESQELYNICLDKYNLWKDSEERQWKHWSINYIDYFGARKFIPKGSSFT